VKVGPDSEPAILVLPSGVSLNHIVAAVRRHHGEPLSEIIERLIDRPLWSIPDNQREILHSLLSLAAVCYKECGRELLQKLQDVQVEWEAQQGAEESQLHKYQEDVRRGVHRFLRELTQWQVPTVQFTSPTRQIRQMPRSDNRRT